MNNSTIYIAELVDLWIRLQGRELLPDRRENIVWSLTPNCVFSTSSAYKAQFFGA